MIVHVAFKGDNQPERFKVGEWIAKYENGPQRLCLYDKDKNNNKRLFAIIPIENILYWRVEYENNN